MILLLWSIHATLVMATPTITQKNQSPCAESFDVRQPNSVRSMKRPPQGGMKKGKTQYERDVVQEGEETRNP